MKALAASFVLILASIAMIRCGKGKENTLPDNGLDLQISLITSFTTSPGDEIIFNYFNGKGPLATDKLVLTSTASGSEYLCTIVRVTSSDFAFTIPKGTPSGRYNIAIRRGDVSKTLGSVNMTVIERSDLEPKDGCNVYGLVTDGKEGVPGVVVSDGFEVTVTDSEGAYYLKSEKRGGSHGYVFISVPGGYEAASEGFLPVFWQAFKSPVSTAERFDFELSKVSNDKFTMFILGDMHLANRNSDMNQFKSFADDLNATLKSTSGKKYALTLGDMTWDLYWYSNSFGFPQYIDLMNSQFSGIQFYHTMGNHDNDYQRSGDFAKEQPYRDNLTPTYYSFNIGKVHFVVMDDIDFNSTGTGTDIRGDYLLNFTAEQMAWLRKDLSFVTKDRPVVLSTHAPVFRPNTDAKTFRYGLAGANAPGEGNTEDLLAVLSGYTTHFFTGHTHKTFNYDNLAEGKTFEHNAGSVCGTWWWSGSLTPGVNVAQDGAPGGYTVLSVDGTGIEWVYKSAGYDASHQFRSYDMNEARKVVTSALGANQEKWEPFVQNISSYGTDEVLLNIWNWDPGWRISVTEGGKELDVVQVWQYDPLHMIAMTAKRFQSTANPNFLTEPYNHFFIVKASSATSTLEIKVTDRFGNVSSETMTRPKAFSTDAYKSK